MSLLKELKRRIEARGEIACAYLAMNDEDLRGPLVDALKIDPDATLEAAYANVTKAHPRLRYLFGRLDCAPEKGGPLLSAMGA